MLRLGSEHQHGSGEEQLISRDRCMTVAKEVVAATPGGTNVSTAVCAAEEARAENKDVGESCTRGRGPWEQEALVP